MHAFLSLMLASIVVGALSSSLPGEEGSYHLVQAVELSMTEFGIIAGKIAFVIALASILGVALTLSGAAERIVIRFMNLFGERFAPAALLLSGFVLSIPVFFDTVFFLLIPIAYSMGKRMPSKYMFFVLAVCVGAAITHHLVPPTPGPLIMAETLELNLGMVIIVGLIAGLIPAAAGYLVAKRVASTMDVRPPDLTAEGQSSDMPKKGLPPFSIAILPIIVPLLLIILASANQYFFAGSSDSGLTSLIQFIGNKNVAMLIGTLLALWILARQQEWGLIEVGKSMEKPLEIAGIIILITSAGGAFGGMIRYCGISEWIQGIVDAGFQMNYILLAWLVAALMKIAQGSGTVSMITSAGILYALINGVELPYHPVYILLSIGFGAMFISWMNDSGFWVVCKLSGFTEKQTLKSWTVTLASIGVVGLILTFLLATVFPMI